MKLMIKIPKDSYEEILQGDYIPDGNFRKNMIEAIRSGTPLTENTDAISRAEVLDLIDSKDPNYEVRHFKEDVECLPSASTEKMGHWIHRKMDNECWEECSECHVERAYPTLYCPDCGARMEVKE